MIEVTDPALLQKLNSPSGQEVTDPDILAQLNGQSDNGGLGDLAQQGISLGAGALKGASELGYGLSSLLTGGHSPKVDFSNLESVKNNPGLYTTGNIAGSIASGVPEYNAALAATKMLPGAASLASRSPAIANILTNLGAGGAIGAGGSPDNRLMGGVSGAAMGATFPAISEGLSGLGRGVTGTLTQENQPLNDALQRTGLSNQIPVPYKTGNDFAQKQYENILSNIPGSGVLPDMKNIGKALDNHTKEILSSFYPKQAGAGEFGVEANDRPLKDAPDVKSEVLSKINKQFEENNDLHKEMYENLANYADSNLTKIELPTYRQSLQDILDKAKDPAAQALLQEPPANVVSTAQKALGGFENMKDKPLSFNDATKADAALNKRIKEAYGSGDYESANFFKQQKSALNNDIEKSVNNSGDPQIISAWQQAKGNFAQNVAPFFDENLPLAKYIGQKDNSPLADKILPDLVKKGELGNSIQLQKVLNLVPSIKNDLGYLHLTSGKVADDGKGISSVMLRQYKKLNPDVAKVLYNPETLQKIEDLHTVTSGLGTLPNVLHNINTGQKTNATNVLKAVGGGGLAGAYALGGLPAVGLSIPLIMGGARGANRFLTSQLANKIASGGKIPLGSLSSLTAGIVPHSNQG